MKNTEQVRKMFPEGTRVQLVYMDDRQAPPIGTKGTVQFVDDMNGVHTRWDNGSGLAFIYGFDEVKIIK